MFQSFAVFMASPKENPSALGYNKVKSWGMMSWRLLFPVNGVAVKLEDGVGVTWPGSMVPHCSSLPMHTHDCYSLFTTLNWSLEKCFLFQSFCDEERALLDLAENPLKAFKFHQTVAVRMETKNLAGSNKKWWSKFIVVGIRPKTKQLRIRKIKAAVKKYIWVDQSDAVPCPV